MKKSKPNKQPNRYLILTGAAFQMGATIYLAAFCGKKLDQKFPNEQGWFTIGLTLLGVVVSMYLLLKQVNRLNDD
ncbi:MAG: AtpZ/AtpI family protein [Flavobacteriaceae bacterium]|nr:AtpZ/AtpI family protein [Flavobacteriaceae bacterium]